jgi:ABC-type nitrate/sulfonate/bicarbonate transport system substrate-binding protein
MTSEKQEKPMKVVIPDLVSNSYFPAIAAVEMGFFKEEGLDAELELIYPVGKCYEALRDGKADFVGGSSHSAPTAFTEWQGVKFLGALAQHTYWFLIMRSDLKVARGDLSSVKGKRIGAAPLIDIGLIEMLKAAGIDPKRDNVQIAPPPMPANPAGVSFGVNAAKAMEEGKIDGFWANGMGAEVAVQRGTGTLVLDARRGDGPPSLRGYTFGVLATRADLVEKSPDKAAAAVRALVKTQKALKEDPKRATKVGEKWFPAFEASLIAKLVERDLPYYDPAISKGAFDSMCQFAQATGLTKGIGKYEDVVATQFSNLWKA